MVLVKYTVRRWDDFWQLRGVVLNQEHLKIR